MNKVYGIHTESWNEEGTDYAKIEELFADAIHLAASQAIDLILEHDIDYRHGSIGLVFAYLHRSIGNLLDIDALPNFNWDWLELTATPTEVTAKYVEPDGESGLEHVHLWLSDYYFKGSLDIAKQERKEKEKQKKS